MQDPESPGAFAPAAVGRPLELTVLFCDLVGARELGEKLDPEDLRELVRDYQTACSAVIKHHGGHVAQYLGDGLLLYFGFPEAHDDDPARAVRVGLGIIAAIARLNVRLNQERGFGLAVRVGIHSGAVVVGEMGAGETREQLAIGETPNVAARLQGLAEPNQVVLSAVTRGKLGGLFECASLGARTLKGIAQPLECFRALREVGPAAAMIVDEIGPNPGREDTAERRQLTVMFCDLVGSTQLSQALEPAVLREVVRDYQAASADVIARYDGYIAQYQGDGLLVYFGYPVAHEDDAVRAVHAGLGIIAAIQALNDRLGRRVGVRLAVRIGLHTGPVVAGEMGTGATGTRLALGRTPNVAQGLEAAAAPMTIAISSATHRLVSQSFRCEPLGPQTLKGMAETMAAYRPIEATERSDQSTQLPGGRKLIGRDDELRQLLADFASARSGEGRGVLLEAEPGLGKSELLRHLRARVDDLAGRDYSWQVGNASAYHSGSPLHPVIEMLQRGLRFEPGESAKVRLRKLTEGLEPYGNPGQLVPLLAALLSIPLDTDAGYQPIVGSPGKQREQILAGLVGLLVEMARQRPMVFVLNGVQWLDPSTNEFLRLLLTQVARSRLLLILTCRPPFVPPWETPLDRMVLDRLSATQIEQVVLGVTAGKRLPREVLRQLIERADGVPLFVEELTRQVLDSGHLVEHANAFELRGTLQSLTIPTTLQDSLTARLDQLADIKEVAQLAAVIGGSFSFEMLRAAYDGAEERLSHDLERLVATGLLTRHGVPPRVTYLFARGLAQDAAYSMLLKKTRQRYHRRIAEVLTEQFPEEAERQPELVARHYTEAGEPATAVDYWLAAGLRGLRSCALIEAASHCGHGLSLVETLPESRARDQKELVLQSTLGAALLATRGLGAADVERTYARAQELVGREEERGDLIWTLIGLQVFHFARANMGEALRLGREILRIAEADGDSGLVAPALYHLAATELFCGDFVSAFPRLERVLAIAPPDDRRYTQQIGSDVRVHAHALLAEISWLFGRPDQARRHSSDSIQLARELNNPYALVIALVLAGTKLHGSLLRDPATAQQLAHQAAELAAEQGYSHWQVQAAIYAGWATIHVEGSSAEVAEEALAGMQQALAFYQGAGARLAVKPFLALQAEALSRLGRPDQALAVIEQALGYQLGAEDREMQAELHRLHGQFTLASSGAGERGAVVAEASFAAALEVARGQRSPMLTLRAATSMARLWTSQGKSAAARALVAEVYAQFTEGFDTPDLIEAKRLLDSLAD